MESALIGLFGLIVGIILSEYFRRKRRIENYSSRIFERRLTIYEEFFNKIHEATSIHSDMFADHNLSNEKKNDIAVTAGLSLMKFCDDSKFYLNEEIIVHCGATFVGVSDFFEETDESKKEQIKKDFFEGIRDLYEMIKKESGINQIDNLFRSITKAKHQSHIIDYYKEIKSKQK